MSTHSRFRGEIGKYELQSTLVISNSKGLKYLEISVLRHIRVAERKNHILQMYI